MRCAKRDLRRKKCGTAGDNPRADIEGAAQVGIFPVWYDNDTDRKEAQRKQAPGCECLHIQQWQEMVDVLRNMEAIKR